MAVDVRKLREASGTQEDEMGLLPVPPGTPPQDIADAINKLRAKHFSDNAARDTTDPNGPNKGKE